MEKFLSPFWFTFITQAAGALGITASVIAFQCKKHKTIMIFRTANELLFAVQYAFLGAYTGVAMNVFGSLRNVVFTEMVKRDKNTVPMRFVFSAVFLGFIIYTWAGVQSALSGFAKILSTFAYGSKNLILMRALILTTSSCWFVYNLMVKSYAGCACEAFTIISLIVGIIRYKPNNKEKGENMFNKVKNGVIIAGHRGNPVAYPENTIESFNAAISAGADVIETDVHETKDGVLVLMHDENVNRMTGVDKNIADMTLSEIKSLTITGKDGAAYKIPTLDEFLAACAALPNFLFDLEIKVYSHVAGKAAAERAADKTIETLEKFNVSPDRVIINCFDAYVLEYVFKKYGKRFSLHGFYPYSLMKNVELNPDEYLSFACFWGVGDNAKDACEYLLARGIAPCTGVNTKESDFYANVKLGVKMFTENDPASAVLWRDGLNND